MNIITVAIIIVVLYTLLGLVWSKISNKFLRYGVAVISSLALPFLIVLGAINVL